MAEDSSWERWRLKDLAKISPGAGGRAGRSTLAGEVQHLQTWRRRQEVHRVQELLLFCDQDLAFPHKAIKLSSAHRRVLSASTSCHP